MSTNPATTDAARAIALGRIAIDPPTADRPLVAFSPATVDPSEPDPVLGWSVGCHFAERRYEPNAARVAPEVTRGAARFMWRTAERA